MKTVAIVQARMGSSRLPGKVMKAVAGHRLIDLLLRRLRQAQTVDEIVLATTEMSLDDQLVNHVAKQGIRVVRGSESDVLSRYLKAVNETGATTVIRITGDCPFVMPDLVDELVSVFHASEEGLQYLSNIDPPTYPDGLDIEVFTAESLHRAGREAHDSYDREHVTPFLRREDGILRDVIRLDRDLSALRLTVDEPDDLIMVEAVMGALAPNLDFNLEALFALYDEQPMLFTVNSAIVRNEGANMSNGQKLWKRAKRVIPGGNMLLSKRAEMFLPDRWPAYFKRTDGCRVWDMDGTELIDAGFMGIGTNTLGYSHAEVDGAVMEVVRNGNMCTLNAPEEVLLAERLVEINSPWAEMVRFARSGGEANAIAIRIGRAASGRDGVAICGYHGWHDWYLSANLADDANLDGHLLPGLNPRGVPRNLAGNTMPFMYNDFAALEKLVATDKIGVIKMEVVRNVEPTDDFLQKVRALADANGIVLIFDECTSGFRETFGGLYKKYGVEPDMAVYGKTIGNGYAVTAVVGRGSVMEAAQSTFISSTFWTERIGSVAALKTLEVMEREESWTQITDTGNDYRTRLREVADSHDVEVVIGGLPSLTTWFVQGENVAGYKTLVTQEMLKRGFLAPPAFYASLAHTPMVLDRTFEALDEVLGIVADCKAERQSLERILEGPICHTGFNRLN